MKHVSIAYILSLVVCWVACSKDEQVQSIASDPGIVFGEIYRITREGTHKSAFLDTIVFFPDGSYLRTEVTGRRNVHEGPGYKTNRYYIDSLKGDWKWENAALYLYDKEVLSCRCQLYGDTIGPKYDCDLTADQIPFGASEWYTGFTADLCEDRTILLESILSYRARTQDLR